MFATLYGKLLIGCLSALTGISFLAALTNRKTDDSYTSVIMTSLAYGLIEIIWFACSTDLVTFSNNIVKLVGSVRVVFIVILAYLLVNYFMTRNGRKLDIKVLIFMLVQVVIMLDVNIFYNLLFDYTEETGLIKGTLYPAPYIVFALFGLLLLIMTLAGKKKDILALMAAVLMIGGGIGQFFTEELPIIYLVFSLILLAITLTLPSRKARTAEPAEEEEQPVEETEQPQPETAEEIIEEPETPEIEEVQEPEFVLPPEPEVADTAQDILVSSVEQLPEYKFDFIDEALQEDAAAEAEPFMPAEQNKSEIIADEHIIDDIPELRQIEELIESETFPDLPVVEEEISEAEPEIIDDMPEPEIIEEPEPVVYGEPEPQIIEEPQPAVYEEPEPEVISEPEPEPKVISEPEPEPEVISEPEPEAELPVTEQPETENEDYDIQSLLNQISETIGSEDFEQLPAIEPQPEVSEPLPEDTLTSLNAIQQAYNQEIETDRRQEKEKQARQQLRNEKIISKPVISPLGPVVRPKPAEEQPVEEPAVKEEPAAPTIRKVEEVRKVVETAVAAAETVSFIKPQAVAKLPVSDMLTGKAEDLLKPKAEEEKPKKKGDRRSKPTVALPSIDEIITASQIAHKQPAEEIPEEPVEETVQPAVQEEEKPETARAAYRPRRRKSLRLMIIGSMNSEVRMISEHLKKEKGYRVDVIDDGYLAMELLAGPFAKVFDAILAVDQPSYSDIYTTIRMIRDCEISEIASLPVICLVNDDARRNMAIQNIGIDAFVKRPLDLDKLSGTIREQLERHGW